MNLQPELAMEMVNSLAFPTVSVAQLQAWLQLRETGTDLTGVKAVRQALQC